MKLKCALVILIGSSFLGVAMAQNIEMVVGEKVFEVQMIEHEAARDFVSQLPISVIFENFSTTERIAYLDKPLTIGASPTKTEPKSGDFAYYIPWGNICVFIRDFSPSDDLVPMGRMSAEAMDAVKNSGKKPVTFQIKRKQ